MNNEYEITWKEMALRVIAYLEAHYPPAYIYAGADSRFVGTGGNTIFGAHFMKKNIKFALQN